MKISVSPLNGLSSPSRAAVSSERTLVVPTAITRPARAAGRHRIDHLLRHFQPLTMHMVFFYALHAHRLEGAGTDMQGDIGGLDPGIAQCIQQGLIEMQPGGRSRHAPARCA